MREKKGTRDAPSYVTRFGAVKESTAQHRAAQYRQDQQHRLGSGGSTPRSRKKYLADQNKRIQKEQFARI